MTTLNPSLLQMARYQLAQEKRAAVPAGGGGDPSMGGMPPGGGGDPSMGGGMPPGMPPGGGGMPMGGAMPMGGMPLDPSMMGGMPPAAPAAPAAVPGAAAPTDPMTGAPAQQKLKPEQMMQVLDYRLYNIQMQLTALMNAFNIQLPPGALVTPPGSPTPVAEAALPGGPQDPTAGMPAGDAGAAAGGGGGDPAAAAGGGGGGSAIQPISPVQGASPELAKAAMHQFLDGLVPQQPQPALLNVLQNQPVRENAMAIAALLRHRATHAS